MSLPCVVPAGTYVSCCGLDEMNIKMQQALPGKLRNLPIKLICCGCMKGHKASSRQQDSEQAGPSGRDAPGQPDEPPGPGPVAAVKRLRRRLLAQQQQWQQALQVPWSGRQTLEVWFFGQEILAVLQPPHLHLALCGNPCCCQSCFNEV